MAALFSELSNPVPNHISAQSLGGSTLEDKRALELALELTLLNFGDPMAGNNGFSDNLMSVNQHHHHHHQQSSLDNQLAAAAAAANNPLNAFNTFIGSNGVGGEERTKKSQNMTECVPVPSSEHVAEIVGRQGKWNRNYLQIYIVL